MLWLPSNVDYVYFVMDTLSHSVYYTFIQIARTSKVPFGYIHGVNIDANIKQIWTEVVGEKQVDADFCI